MFHPFLSDADEAADGNGAGGADEEVGTDADSQGGFNCRPDGPNAIVFCPANFNFFIFRGIYQNSCTDTAIVRSGRGGCGQ